LEASGWLPEWNARMHKAKQVLIEGLLLLALGGALALAANFISPRGLALTRNYFPGGSRPALSLAGTNAAAAIRGTHVTAASSAELLAARLQAKGLQVVDSNQVVQIFRDPRREQELFIFIDSRAEAHYLEGHVPGAYLFDHYRAENYLATVLPACRMADKILVYCHGGNCEDSEFAAVILSDAGVPKERLLVYPGGFGEWTTNGLPVETGERNSHLWRPAKP
jgi:rhodanese-related sulfurtransferase